MQMNTGGSIFLVFHAKRPTASMRGMKLRCFDLSIALPKAISSPGISRNTESMEKIMDFMSTLPRSPPRPNCIKVMATRPPMVVRLEEAISGMAFARASTMASYCPRCCFSSAKRLHSITA